MKILICISNVPDTTTKIRFVNNASLDTNGVQWIINPWDELALTRALELKEGSGGSIDLVNVISVGPLSVEATLRKALAIGADEAIRVDGEANDAYFVAFQIAEAIKDDGYDLILAGIESSDYNGSSIGSMVAELLSISSVSSVSSIEMESGNPVLKREIDGGTEIVHSQMPMVAIAQKGIALEPRIPSMRGIMMARKKPLKVVASVATEILTEYAGFELPAPKAACKMINEDNVKELIGLLHTEAKVI